MTPAGSRGAVSVVGKEDGGRRRLCAGVLFAVLVRSPSVVLPPSRRSERTIPTVRSVVIASRDPARRGGICAMTQVATATGHIDSAELGTVLPHEHVRVRREEVLFQFPHLFDDEAAMERALWNAS